MAVLLLQPKVPKHFAPAQTIPGVHFEQPDRSAPHRRFADDTGSVEGKMIRPLFTARVEQRRHLARVGINAAKVRAFLVIALRAGEREIRRVIRAAMLPGDDVFDVKTEGGSGLRETAVFAALSGPLAHELADGAVHSGRLGVGEKGVRLRLEHTEEGVGPDDGFEISLFRRGQLAFGALGGKFVVAVLRLGVGLDTGERAGEFKRKVLRERSEETLQCGCRAVCHARNIAAIDYGGENSFACYPAAITVFQPA